jgi:demethylmenaquinone methyltransferase/2-methoxy-6-polyprenyl-1,4-benzoquinol methylase
MTEPILQEQLAYYRARAQEYDGSVQQAGRFATSEPSDPGEERDWREIVSALHAIAPCEHVLELACGTGIWTKELLQIGSSISALDGAQEMLDINRAKLADARVQYECADLFAWQPRREYDLVFFAFWLSHVPPEQLDRFLDTVVRATRPGGRIFIVDEPANGKHLSGEIEPGNQQTRTLHDGRSYKIVKAYYDPRAIQERLSQRGFTQFSGMIGECFFCLSGTREIG